MSLWRFGASNKNNIYYLFSKGILFIQIWSIHNYKHYFVIFPWSIKKIFISFVINFFYSILPEPLNIIAGGNFVSSEMPHNKTVYFINSEFVV